MPFTRNNGAAIHWETAGLATSPVLVLLNSIGTGIESWDDCIAALAQEFRLLRIDTRGHGASEAPEGDYSLAALAEDVFAVMDAAGVADAAVAGVSLGGMVAMQMALSAPQRVSKLILICTSARMDAAAWSDRVENVRANGLTEISDLSIGRFFSPDFVRQYPERVETVRRALLAMPSAGYAGAGAAIRDMDIFDRLGAIAAATLVIAGKRDVSTPFESHGKVIAKAIPASVTALIDAAHLAQIEAPQDVTQLMIVFLGGETE